MVDPLAPLLADGVIDEVVARLKSGKEADLWLVRHRGEVIAAKVYKARDTRSFKNDAAYREGRRVRNTRTQRAMDRGSRFGQAAAEEAWKSKEADALHALHAAGVRVPAPVLFYEGVLLMELVLGVDGHPAPRLVDAHVRREQAAALYADLRGQAIRMLGCDLVHGDLSPYNVLLGRAGPVVIDFPQVVGAAHNTQAERFFQRDLENLRRFFAALDPDLHAAAGDAREIWRAYVRRELTPDFVPSGRGAEPARGGREPRREPRGTEHRGTEHRGTEHRGGERRGEHGGAREERRDRPARPGPGGQRGRERRMPEVVRVGRPSPRPPPAHGQGHAPSHVPPHGAAPAAPPRASSHPAPHAPPPAPHPTRPPGEGGRRRRRRRRRG